MEETPPLTTETENSLTQTDDSLPKRYYVQFWKKVQPSESRFDELAGTIYWSDVKEDIIIEGLNNKYSSDVEGFFGNDLALPNGIFISWELSRKEWVTSLHNAQLTGNFYAVQSMEMIDET